MRRALALAVLAAAGVGCGSATDPAAKRGGGERAAVLRVMEAGRKALLAGDGKAACRLLTPHGRKRALGFQVDFDHGVPKTCVGIVRAEFRLEHDPDVDQSWTPDLKAASFRVTSLDRDRARVRLTVPGASGPTVEFSLRKTAHGWRIDDSDAVPSGD